MRLCEDGGLGFGNLGVNILLFFKMAATIFLNFESLIASSYCE